MDRVYLIFESKSKFTAFEFDTYVLTRSELSAQLRSKIISFYVHFLHFDTDSIYRLLSWLSMHLKPLNGLKTRDGKLICERQFSHIKTFQILRDGVG